MVLSASPCSLARSSLEEMLDSLRRRDEEEEKKDSPPALPARPASRARLPPARRSLPNNFRVGGSQRVIAPENGVGTNGESDLKENDLGQKRRRNCFERKRMNKDVESPYVALSSSDSSGMVWELDDDDNISYFIKKKLRVWCRQPRGQWELGTIQSTSGEEASISLSNGNVIKVVRSEILPANPGVLEGVDDLIKLGYLNEPSVLHNLKLRYSQGMIYNKAGPILIALNPFKDLQTNGNDYVSAYRQRIIDSLHVYAVADVAYNKMIRDEVNQSIIISGESGSGKTETAKIALQHLAALGGGGSCAIENEFLQINRILEAFGNAKTSRNNNSSRFSRVVQLANGERSYHIFYQLCAGSSSDLKAVTSTAQLMGCSSQELMTALCSHKIQSDEDTIAKNLTLRQAIERRDAIAKFIYASLFDWLVEQVNKSLEVGKQYTGKSISILDIYGFQTFQKNSFEQFYINYANERIQQHFNRHLFKLEQEDYELDGVDWTKVDFEDNEVCLDLFEKKPHGLLSLLDEESNLAKASDLTFANKLKHHLNANPCFKGEKGRAFRVRHYAGEVLYDTNGFLEKNRDMLSSDSIQFLSSCNCELLQLFSKMFNQSQMQSVATKFKVQLFMLMHQLESTTPHFIRCIKPNTKQLPGIFDEVLVLQQLRCCEVLEVVRVSRAGYPTRMAHQEFSRRYGFLLSEANVLQDPLSISVAVLQKFNIPSEMYHVGYTKLYLRAGQIDSLENKRKQVLQGILGIQKCFRGHRALIRGENTRRKYGVTVKSSVTIYSRILEEIHAIILLQSVIRGWLVRRGDASHINRSKRYPENAKPRWKSFMKIIPEVKPDLSKEPVQNLLSALADLQRRVDKADAIVKQKEDENTELREQLKQSERKRIEYETKMKSMEEAWQKQMASLQMSLVAARKSLAPENASVQPVRRDFVLPRGYDSEDATSMGSRTPGGSTPMLSGSLSASDAGRQVNGTLTTVGNLMKEFEQERQNFDDEVKALNDVKPEQSANTNSFEELRKLKQRFEGWKNQYKVRLRETKTRLYKSETEKSRRTWWGKLSSKA
ncbi:Myosin-2 [Glycine max]|nr:Myosin-2 [Glycine max]